MSWGHRARRYFGVLFGLAASLGSLAGEAGKEGDRPPEPLRLPKPLIAHWAFDEHVGVNCLDSSANGYDASPEQRHAPGLERMEGVFGGALRLSGRHLLRIPEKPAFGTLPKLSFSAWVMPTEWEKYNEIFRKEDGDQRVLFSFQEEGTILSLGLNIGGYIECDAKMDPAQLLDGAWHHCAATFDGEHMRVYLDGKEIGALKRPGQIVAGGTAPGCIGSANGGECFQGALDDLRIYKDALTPEEVAQLHQNGQQSLTRQSDTPAADEPKVDRPLLAHWTFNERSGAALLRNAAGNTALDVKLKQGLGRSRGVHGNALELRGQHALAVGGLPLADLAKITFSAWTRPTDLKGFREIFRQDCPSRLLFAFQENGSVLSLGLNVGGYEELDARIEPAKLLDGQWHHCAATFDGEAMRVYLDGKEVGSLRRPGKLATQPDAPAFLGSSGGAGEHFQGSLDDVRLYGDALTADQVALLYRSGLDSLARISKELEQRVNDVYVPAKTFPEALAGTRKKLAEKAVALDRDLANAVLGKLRAAFPAECENLTLWTGNSLVDYLLAHGNEFHHREVGRLVELLVEYKPLTEPQWKKRTPEDRKKWEEAEALQKRFEALKAQGDAAQFSPDWVAIILEAGGRIQHRPHVNEAVAPYVTPHTPETRPLTAAEARDALERDWLHQADQNPTPERIRNEIAWTRALAERITNGVHGPVDLTQDLAQLADLEKQTADLKAANRDYYLKVREVKRRIAFKNPVVDFNRVLLVDMPFPQGSEWPHETRHRLGYMAVPGGRLLILEGLSPEGKLTQLMPQPPLHGSFWRPDLSWDAGKVLFCFKPHNDKSFHLYEINADGTGLAQLTDGIFDDFDPIYLPDEKHLVFSTTRGHTYVRCMPPTNAYSLARCDRDGRNIYLISVNNEPDYLPSVMNDGRIVYTRWEYTDKPLWRAEKLWTINPDGTQVSVLWGNQSVWPDLVKDARSIPGSRRVLVTGSAHHNWFSGSVGIIDPDKGFNFPDGLTKVTADTAWPECGNGPVDPIESPAYHPSGHYPAYYSPYPLSEKDFLVSANRGGRFVLYLMDVDGNRELIYEGVHNIFHALPLRPRPKPPVIQDRVAWPSREERLKPHDGILYSRGIYQIAPAEIKDKVRFLRVLTIDAKTYTYWHKRPALSTGPVVSTVQSEGVKRVLGTVPVEADGSFAFHAPPGIPLHFQLLDEHQRALHTMRSFVGVMPGERRGCIGCHESHSRSPMMDDYKTLAAARDPNPITPPPWGVDTVSYPRYVKPVLEKYCGKCHTGDGEGRKVFDLTDRPGSLGFSEVYYHLIGRPSWGAPYQAPKDPPPGFGIADMIMVEAYGQIDPVAYQTPKPMTKLSYKSRLIERASSGKHHDVKMEPNDLLRLILWVDTMCPYRGEEEVREIEDPTFQGVDWLAIRPRIKTAPRITRPGPVD